VLASTHLFSRIAFPSMLTVLLLGTAEAQRVSPLGPYSFVLNASYSNPSNQGGLGLLGVMNFDGIGNVSGPYTLELGSGGQLPVTTITGNLTGTYTLGASGTVSITLALDNGTGFSLGGVTGNSGHGLQLVATSCSGPYCDLSGSVINGVGESQLSGPVRIPKNPRPVPLQGSFQLQSAKTSPTPFTSLGVIAFDGAGDVTESLLFVGPGPSSSTGAYSGTYSVNPDGTGSITFAAVEDQGAQTFVFAIVDGGSGLLLMQINRSGNGVITGSAQLQ